MYTAQAKGVQRLVHPTELANLCIAAVEAKSAEDEGRLGNRPRKAAQTKAIGRQSAFGMMERMVQNGADLHQRMFRMSSLTSI